jgi:hypothetical protein
LLQLVHRGEVPQLRGDPLSAVTSLNRRLQ